MLISLFIFHLIVAVKYSEKYEIAEKYKADKKKYITSLYVLVSLFLKEYLKQQQSI